MDDPDGMYGPIRAFLEGLPATLPGRPDAIVVVTAHWEAAAFTIASGPNPELIYDYGGFPPHTYEVTYPAPGAPEVARRAAELASAQGIEVVLDPDHGWDHGVFVPLAVSWPNADIPVVAVSLKVGLDPAEHLEFGAALEQLRSENIVIIGSGLNIHDLSFRITAQQSAEFDAWLEDTMEQSPEVRSQRLIHWRQGPNATIAHPREEHLLPLMTIAGAGGNSSPVRTHRDLMFGLPAAAYTFK